MADAPLRRPVSDSLPDRLDGIVHEPTQVHDDGVDLTLDGVYRVLAPGRVDFGGGELAPPDLEPVPTTLRNVDDDYEWWHLDAGTYLVAYNEDLTGDAPVRLQVREALRTSGVSHPTLRTASLDPMPLTVPTGGIRLKENARITTASSIE